MKNKIIFFLSLVLFVMPLVSQAFVVPQANLTIVVNTQGQDGTFNFQLSGGQQFGIPTQGLTGSKKVQVVIGPGYSLSQSVVSGLTLQSVQCVSDNPADVFSYGSNSVGFSAINKENITCTFNNVLTKTPVLIVPGLLGTEIQDGNQTLWLNLGSLLTNADDSFMDGLGFNKDLSPIIPSLSTSDVIGKETIAGATVSDYTDGLITEFQSQGYIENQNLFTFPYDWRYGASGKYPDGSTNETLLAQKIQAILTQTGSSKVDIVAHSEGGLIVKKYVMDNPTSNGIDKAVFVGVPNTGAPYAAKVLLQGDNFGISFLGFGLSSTEIKNISANMPTAYDLLPSQQYYNIKGSFVQVVQEAALDGSTPYSKKDLNYQDFTSFLTNDHGFNAQALTSAEALHTAAFDNFDMRTAGVDVYSIDGCKTGTIGQIVEDRYTNAFGQNFVDYKRPTLVPGDKTVPLESSTNLPMDDSKKFYSLNADHGKMLSQDGSKEEIVNLLTGSSLPVNSKYITQDISQCDLNGKAISVFSPVNVFVTDQDGNQLGLNPDGSTFNQIPNADFEVFGDHKFLYLPTDAGQTYTITMQGTATGTYTIDSQDIANSQVTGTQVFSNLPVTTALTGSINLGTGAGATTLTVQQTPTAPVQTIAPSATLTAVQSQDVLAPVSTATVVGTQGQSGFYKSNVAVNVNATDDSSGVLAINYALDNGAEQKVSGATASIPVATEGAHTLTFFSTDNAGNNEQVKTLTFTIDKTAPEAVVQFDPAAMDLHFSGTDNISPANLVTVLDQDNVITLTDQAGNTTVINLRDKNRKIIMSAQILSIKNNGVAADISNNDMAYLWLVDKTKKLTTLSQYVKAKNDYNVLAVYDGKNTKLLGKDASGLILKSVAGLQILKITTNKGNLGWSY